MKDTHIWTGASGKKYPYHMFPTGTYWDDVGGNYVFCRESSPNKWEAIYIGQTDSFKKQLPAHAKSPEVEKYGVTHIHIHINNHREGRLKEEADLVEGYDPPGNII